MNSLPPFISAGLFCIGLLALIRRQSVLAIFIGILVIFGATCLNLTAFSRFRSISAGDQLTVVFVIILTVIQMAVLIGLLSHLSSEKPCIDEKGVI